MCVVLLFDALLVCSNIYTYTHTYIHQVRATALNFFLGLDDKNESKTHTYVHTLHTYIHTHIHTSGARNGSELLPRPGRQE
jgi:hypothetical protein